MARITLTENVMDKIYILASHGLLNEEIAYTVGCSNQTVRRVKGVATAICNGNPEALEKNFYHNSDKNRRMGAQEIQRARVETRRKDCIAR